MLYLGSCVESCPKYSSLYNDNICIDVKENYPNADAIMRAFYDNIISNFLSQNLTTLVSFV